MGGLGTFERRFPQTRGRSYSTRSPGEPPGTTVTLRSAEHGAHGGHRRGEEPGDSHPRPVTPTRRHAAPTARCGHAAMGCATKTRSGRRGMAALRLLRPLGGGGGGGPPAPLHPRGAPRVSDRAQRCWPGGGGRRRPPRRPPPPGGGGGGGPQPAPVEPRGAPRGSAEALRCVHCGERVRENEGHACSPRT